MWKKEVFEDKQRKQHEDREASYFVIFRFIFVIKPGNCQYIVSAFVCRTTSGQAWNRTLRYTTLNGLHGRASLIELDKLLVAKKVAFKPLQSHVMDTILSSNLANKIWWSRCQCWAFQFLVHKTVSQTPPKSTCKSPLANFSWTLEKIYEEIWSANTSAFEILPLRGLTKYLSTCHHMSYLA